MAISRITTWSAGQVLTAAALNGEFNNILSNPIALWSPAASAINFNGQVLTWDAAAVTTVSSSASQAWQFTPGAKTGTPGATGSIQNWVASTYTDNNTAASGTAALFAAHALQRPTLAATNTGVVTTDAATFYIANSPATGANETITNAWALLIASGNAKIAGSLTLGTALTSSNGGTGLNSSASTGVPSISSGTWSVASTLATTLGGTGVNTSARFKILQITRDMTAASGAVTTAHGVTGTPKFAILVANRDTAKDFSVGVSDGSTNYCMRYDGFTPRTDFKSTAAVWLDAGSLDTDSQTATVTFDATNVTLTWTKNGAPGASNGQVLIILFF